MQVSRQRHQANGGQGNNLLPTLPTLWGEASPVRNRRGFTLLELLVVIAILAGTAFIASSTFKGVGAHADERLVLTEMQEIAKALRQFKMDTGYYPQQGPFGLAIDSGAVVNAGLPEHVRGLANASKRRWFNSPANFYQLLDPTSPLTGSGHQLEEWKPETGRGWRGPYLSGFRDGYVNIREDINSGTMVEEVTGIADPFLLAPATSDLYQWSRTTSDEEWVPIPKWGRPYLFLQLNGRWTLLSLGPDGKYDDGVADLDNKDDDDNDNIVLPIE